LAEDPLDLLPTLAEVSVTLAGFSALLVVIRRGESKWLPSEVVALYVMVGNSLAALLFSLLPLPLVYMGIPRAIVWSLCSVLLAVFILFTGWAIPRLARQRGATPRVQITRRVIPPASYTVVLALGLSALGPVSIRAGVFVFGVIFLLLLAVVPLVIFLAFIESDDEPS
jgi:hypothetical protein